MSSSYHFGKFRSIARDRFFPTKAPEQPWFMSLLMVFPLLSLHFPPLCDEKIPTPNLFICYLFHEATFDFSDNRAD